MEICTSVEQEKCTIYLSLGSNLGDREQNLLHALQLIGARIGSLVRCSSFYYSEPWGFQSEHSFCNLCVSFCTSLSPLEILHATQQIERAMGRTHKSHHGHYQDRLIDIDLLLYITPDGRSLPILTPDLTLPHPLIHLRSFVMTPLIEILPAPTV